MRHQKTRNKLSRSSSHRKALLMNLCKEVIEHERIKTSEAKAKAVKPELEKLITLAKRGDLHARRQALSTLGQDKFVVHTLFAEVAPRYAGRSGGYTRILKLGPRRPAHRLRQAHAGHRDRRLDRPAGRAPRGRRDPDLEPVDLHRRGPHRGPPPAPRAAA
jgi:large subunit ribosomal protein L17